MLNKILNVFERLAEDDIQSSPPCDFVRGGIAEIYYGIYGILSDMIHFFIRIYCHWRGCKIRHYREECGYYEAYCTRCRAWEDNNSSNEWPLI